MNVLSQLPAGVSGLQQTIKATHDAAARVVAKVVDMDTESDLPAAWSAEAVLVGDGASNWLAAISCLVLGSAALALQAASDVAAEHITRPDDLHTSQQ